MIPQSSFTEQFEMSMEERDLLLIHLCRRKRVAQQALNRLQPEHWNKSSELGHRLYWSVVSEFFKANNELPSKPFLAAGLAAAFEKERYIYASFADWIVEFLDKLWSVNDSDLNDDVAINTLLKNILDERVLGPALITAAGKSPSEHFHDVVRSFQNASVSAVKSTDLANFDDPANWGINDLVTPTGHELWDYIVGGMRGGHVTGILAATEGGKTTFLLDLCASVAEQGGRAVFFSYEQSIRHQLKPRIISRVANLTMDVVNKLKLDANWRNDELATTVHKAMNSVPGFITMDMLNPGVGMGGVLEISSIIQDMVARDLKPDLVAIDWLGIMATRYAAGQGWDTSNGLTAVLRDQCDRIKAAIANQFNCEVVLAHQYSNAVGAEVKKSILKRPTAYDAADMRAFPVLMDTCLVFCGRDASGTMLVLPDKNRGEHRECWAALDHRQTRVRMLHGNYVSIPDARGRLTWVRQETI